jgi:hypothetical protein
VDQFEISSCLIYYRSVLLAQSTSTTFNLFSFEKVSKVIWGVSWLRTLILCQGADSKDLPRRKLKLGHIQSSAVLME